MRRGERFDNKKGFGLFIVPNILKFQNIRNNEQNVSKNEKCNELSKNLVEMSDMNDRIERDFL
jgi:hypothetical protein